MGIQETAEYSRLLFGDSYRLALAAWIGRKGGDVFTVDEPLTDLGLGPSTKSTVRKDIERFVEARILVRLPKTAKVVYYEKLDSVFWKAAREVEAEVERLARSDEIGAMDSA
jgi:hypothetical protein